jgi:hypothetical protein
VLDLVDSCTVIRSKQAGPYRLTLDLLFRSNEAYLRVKESGKVTKELVASLYRLSVDQVLEIIFYDPGWAVKVVLIRQKVAGAPGDGDMYGCQQHVPLLSLRLDTD